MKFSKLSKPLRGEISVPGVTQYYYVAYGSFHSLYSSLAEITKIDAFHFYKITHVFLYYLAASISLPYFILLF